MKRACRENDGDREKTVNGTQPQNCFSPSYVSASKIGQAFACCLFLVVSLVGNTVIARTTTKNFILKMAMSDLLLPILVFSVESHWVLILQWWGRPVFCKGNIFHTVDVGHMCPRKCRVRRTSWVFNYSETRHQKRTRHSLKSYVFCFWDFGIFSGKMPHEFGTKF